MILGALIALFGGCKVQKEISAPNNKIMVMYGPPAYFQQQATHQQETQEQNSSPQETPQENNEANTSLPNTH